MSGSDSSESDSESYDTAEDTAAADDTTGAVGVDETKMISCKCKKCRLSGEGQSYCCIQFLKVKQECQKNGLYLSNMNILYPPFLRSELCYRDSPFSQAVRQG